jgi:hypothetical protein
MSAQNERGGPRHVWVWEACLFGEARANNSLFIEIAMTLWACNIGPAKEQCGDIIPIDVDDVWRTELWCECPHCYLTPCATLIVGAWYQLLGAPSRKVDITLHFPEAAALLAGENELQD